MGFILPICLILTPFAATAVNVAPAEIPPHINPSAAPSTAPWNAAFPAPFQLPVESLCFTAFVPAPTAAPNAALVTAILRNAANTGAAAPPAAAVTVRYHLLAGLLKQYAYKLYCEKFLYSSTNTSTSSALINLHTFGSQYRLPT